MSPSSRGFLAADVGVVIPAGGRGVRAGPGEFKPLRRVGGVPMLLRSLRPFLAHDRVCEIVVPLPAEVAGEPPEWLRELLEDRVRVVEGGATRAESVFRGVTALSEGSRWVLVHDAARPFVGDEIVQAIVDRVTAGKPAIAAVPARDTLKRATHGGRITATIDRSRLWRAQTPQGFPRDVLERAYERWEGDLADATQATDESTLVEAAGFAVELVADSSTNIKITTPDDFRIAEALAHHDRAAVRDRR